YVMLRLPRIWLRIHQNHAALGSVEARELIIIGSVIHPRAPLLRIPGRAEGDFPGREEANLRRDKNVTGDGAAHPGPRFIGSPGCRYNAGQVRPTGESEARYQNHQG